MGSLEQKTEGEMQGYEGMASSIFPKIELERREKIEALKDALPESHLPFTDQYFLNSLEVLKHSNLNPWVKVQVSIRNGPGIASGLDEALAIIEKYSPQLRLHGGVVKALREESSFESKEPLLCIEGPIQDIITLETMVLGAITHGSTKKSDGVDHVALEQLAFRASQLREMAQDRTLIYMGARHAHWSEDAVISRTCFDAGFDASSTGTGAQSAGKRASGTTPHIMYGVFAPYVGREEVVVSGMLAYDSALAKDAPRIILPDWNNHEITDTLKAIRKLKERGAKLEGVRLDTHGGIVGEGALMGPNDLKGKDWDIEMPKLDDPDAKYWYGQGVTISGVYAMQSALKESGNQDVKIVLSSGFANPEKLAAFVRASKSIGLRFEVIGMGKLFSCRDAKLELVAAGPSKQSLQLFAKSGRGYQTFSELENSESKLEVI